MKMKVCVSATCADITLLLLQYLYSIEKIRSLLKTFKKSPSAIQPSVEPHDLFLNS